PFGLGFAFGSGFAVGETTLGVGWTTLCVGEGVGVAVRVGVPPPPLLSVTTTETGPALTGVLFGPMPVTDAVFVYDPAARSAGVSVCKHVNTSGWFACSDCGPAGEIVPASHIGSLSVTALNAVGPAVTVVS